MANVQASDRWHTALRFGKACLVNEKPQSDIEELFSLVALSKHPRRLASRLKELGGAEKPKFRPSFLELSKAPIPCKGYS